MGHCTFYDNGFYFDPIAAATRTRPDPMHSKIPFNRPYLTGKELTYIAQALENSHFSGDGPFAERCHDWFADRLGRGKALLTPSCTAALEMAAILADIGPGDEVIMPSYTFVSTANAFVLRGGVPVFVDIRRDTKNIDESLIEAAITPKTRAIVVVHYAGVACEMGVIQGIAERHGLVLIEDAAQALLSSYRGEQLGAIGDLATFSFHETKNVMCGEGGALIINNPDFAERAEIVREKGTNRRQFFRGAVAKYSWVDIGSSYLPGETTAAFLFAQLEEADRIIEYRLDIWNRYDAALKPLLPDLGIETPVIPEDCLHNGHIYYVILRDLDARQEFIGRLADAGVHSVFHYVPLHSSEFGRSCTRTHGTLAVTDSIADRLVRLPLWIGLEAVQDAVVEAVVQALESQAHVR